MYPIIPLIRLTNLRAPDHDTLLALNTFILPSTHIPHKNILTLVPATTPEAITKAVKDTVKALGFIPDLFLIHNPMVIEEGKLGEAWKVLEGLVEDGTLKGTSLGVSNFRPQDLEAVMEVAKIKPVVNREYILWPKSPCPPSPCPPYLAIFLLPSPYS